MSSDSEAEKEEEGRRQRARFEDGQRREDDRREDDRHWRTSADDSPWRTSAEKRAQERCWAWATTKTLLHGAERVLYESLTGMLVSPRSRSPFPALKSLQYLQFPRLFSLVPLADLN